MKSLLEVFHKSHDFLREKEVEAPKRSAERLICHALGYTRSELYLKHDLPLQESELDLIRKLIKRRATKEPVEYIIGSVDFYHLKLLVNPSVLIPRQETEILVDLIVQELHKKDLQGMTLWDIGAGSGAIGLALKKRFPELKVILSDFSKDALASAEENAKINDLEVELRYGDCFSPFEKEKAHFIVSNPPYISSKEYQNLSAEVTEYEPKSALVGGEDGLFYYKKLSTELPNYLQPAGKVFLEIGAKQGDDVRKIFSYAKGKVIPDWAGLDRFFFLELQ